MGSPTKFSIWMRNHLKDAYSGLITQDIDFILLNENRKYFIVEEKNYANARTGPAQAIIYKMLDEILSADSEFLGCHKATVEWNGIWLDQRGKVSMESFLTNPNTHLKNKYNQKWYEQVLYFSMDSLWDGKGIPPTRKTEAEHTFSRESVLAGELLKYNVQRAKIDWIFVNYVTGNFVLLSESDCFDSPIVKRIIDVLDFYNNSGHPVFNPKSKCVYKFLGAYRISYDNSMSNFYINDVKVDVKDAIRILNLDDEEITNF